LPSTTAVTAARRRNREGGVTPAYNPPVTRQPDYEPDPRYGRPAPDRDHGSVEHEDDRYLDALDARARYLEERTADDAARAAYRQTRRYDGEVEPGGWSPFRVVLAIAALGAILFLGFAVLARDIPMLASATLVFGVVFVAVALTAGRATWRAAADGRNGQAFGLAIGGGVAAMAGLGALALAIVLVLIWGRG
jgi:hypothetical protein